jgi:hypothetical protein
MKLIDADEAFYAGIPEALGLEVEVVRKEWSFGQSMSVEEVVAYALSEE